MSGNMVAYNPQIIGVPLHNTPVESLRTNTNGALRVFTLPLNLIAIIVSHIDEVADLARLCRTSRVLHYMCLPQLYNNITLTSYEGVRYRDDRPEGSGSASPFAMGLNALVTRDVVHLVRSLTLRGKWKEYDLAECARIGRVPDNSMMVNIAVRAALDRCVGIESFTWDLNTKLLPSVYGGLINLNKLKSLRIRFPSTRTPRPTCVIPAMPGLKTIVITHIDPLCYPDDISLLIFSAKDLRHLVLHFSPRMRQQSEPSIHLEAYFKGFLGSNRSWKLESVAFYNLFARMPDGMDKIVDVSTLRTITDIRNMCVYGAHGSSFFDDTWNQVDPNCKPKNLRTDVLNYNLVKMLGVYEGLERIYTINDNPDVETNPDCSPTESPSIVNGHSAVPITEAISKRAFGSPTMHKDPNTKLRDAYLNALIPNHGPTLVHLSLPSRWPLPLSIFARLVRSAPSLSQLSVAVDAEGFQALRLLVPFLQKLRIMRLLLPTETECQVYGCGRSLQSIIEQDDNLHVRAMGKSLLDDDGRDAFPNMKYVILGWKVFELGKIVEVEEQAGEVPNGCGYPATPGSNGTVNGDENPSSSEERTPRVAMVKRKSVKRVPWETISNIDIIKMGTREIVV